MDIDKSWEGIIYLLTGQNLANSAINQHPLLKVIFSEQFIDPAQDLGCGPAHYLCPDQVKEVKKIDNVL